jgi:hypothetical protein
MADAPDTVSRFVGVEKNTGSGSYPCASALLLGGVIPHRS